MLQCQLGGLQRRQIALHGDQLTLTSQPILFKGQMRVFSSDLETPRVADVLSEQVAAPDNACARACRVAFS
jgi:hypothetical protein